MGHMAGRNHWKEGWWRDARRSESPNFNARPENAVISLIVLHCISLPPERFGGQEVEDFFHNRLDYAAHSYFSALRDVRVSAHFFLRRNGEITQFVSLEDRAWHAGESRWKNRGNCNDYSVGVELEGSERTAFDPRQYAALFPLLEAVRASCPAVTDIVGHEHIAPRRKTDPGAFFDWDAVAARFPDLCAWRAAFREFCPQ